MVACLQNIGRHCFSVDSSGLKSKYLHISETWDETHSMVKSYSQKCALKESTKHFENSQTRQKIYLNNRKSIT